jgi:hypothetical protein
MMKHRSLGKAAVFGNGAEEFQRAKLQDDSRALKKLILRHTARSEINAR